MLPSAQFQRLVQVRPLSSAVQASNTPEAPHLARLREIGSAGLDKYLGCYFETYLLMACPGRILRTLVCLERREEGLPAYRAADRASAGEGLSRHLPGHCSTWALCTFSPTGFFSPIMRRRTILFPSFKNRVTRLTGLKLGVSGSGERMPCCARVVYEYLGPRIDVRRALRLCGLY